MNHKIHIMIQKFLETQREALHSLAIKARLEYSLEDVHQEAWLVAYEILEKEWIPVTGLSAEFPTVFFKALRRKLSKSSDRKLRYARKLEHPLLPIDGGTGWTLQEIIPDQNERDPLELTVELESLLEVTLRQAPLIIV